MNRSLRILIAALLCLAVAGTAIAATAPYKSGQYKGKTGQVNPKTGKKYGVKFTIAKGKISKVRTFTRDRCPDGTHLIVTQNAFKTTKLDSKGRFTLLAGTAEQPAVMKGKVSGSKASGTITDRTNDTAEPSSGACKASTKWSATLVK
jgi:opacity protein-like surface antigen